MIGRRTRRRLFVTWGLCLAATSCTEGPNEPSRTYPPIALACPAAVTLPSSHQAVVGFYGAPTVSGGDPPLTTTCTPGSGSTFPVGSTTVTCTATDALNRTERCSFILTVVAGPELSVTNVLAFGDSMTAGAIIAGTDIVVVPSEAYPADLQALLSQRYVAQPIVVFNDGKVGETTVEGASRLPGELALHHPDVLLLLEGINDLHGSAADGGIPAALSALGVMIQHARSAGAQVIVGTLLPAMPGALLPRTVALIEPFNTQLVPMARANGAIVVDLHSAFLADMPDWIGPDGLHPTVAGYQEMAQVLFNTIRTSFEGLALAGSQSRPTSRGPSGAGSAAHGRGLWRTGGLSSAWRH